MRVRIGKAAGDQREESRKARSREGWPDRATKGRDYLAALTYLALLNNSS